MNQDPKSATSNMPKRSSWRTARPLAATAATIGSAGLILGAPAAGLLAAPGVVQAAPVVAAPQQFGDLLASIPGAVIELRFCARLGVIEVGS